MKKILTFGLGGLVLIGLLFFAATQVGRTQSTTNEKQKTLTFAATGTSFPTAYKKDGKLVGFDVELANAVAKGLGYKTQWITSEFDGLFGQLDNGKINTIANDVAVTPERAKKYLFTKTYNTEATTVAVAQNSAYKTLKDLEGKTVAGAVGSNNTANLKAYDAKINVKTFEGRDDIYQALLVGHVDGVINTRNNLAALIKAKGYKWKILRGNAASVEIAFPFPKDAAGKKLQKQFNAELTKLEKNGTLSKLSQKYFGYDVSQNLK